MGLENTNSQKWLNLIGMRAGVRLCYINIIGMV